MHGTLVITVLKVRSSYLQNVEWDLVSPDDIPDTLQWWVGADRAFRIKTFALDHDIHVHELTSGGPKIVELALANNAKNYGDVIAQQYVVEVANCEDHDLTAAAFAATGLPPSLTIEPGHFAFRNPDQAEYIAQSRPE